MDLLSHKSHREEGEEKKNLEQFQRGFRAVAWKPKKHTEKTNNKEKLKEGRDGQEMTKSCDKKVKYANKTPKTNITIPTKNIGMAGIKS